MEAISLLHLDYILRVVWTGRSPQSSLYWHAIIEAKKFALELVCLPLDGPHARRSRHHV